jgi:hypothetical protein
LGLSAKGLGYLHENVFAKDFTFIVGSDRWECPSFIAAFLSPWIAALQRNDPTLHEFTITTNDSCHNFATFLLLVFGSTVKISSTKLAFVQSICCKFWNGELHDPLFVHTDHETPRKDADL